MAKAEQLPLGERLTSVRKGQRVILSDGVRGVVTEVTNKHLRGIMPDFWLQPDDGAEYRLGCYLNRGIYSEST